ncbi:hypothetical protein PIB30_055305 [Stylosanthes scabra]|uniref:Uncharacterized protein n=1 Tax=Stylosanthes scabra TaxID=79078 RepID=A0ABU6ZHP5_9FABA|nr:hypothetical protein [Stylosanthes scabra]
MRSSSTDVDEKRRAQMEIGYRVVQDVFRLLLAFVVSFLLYENVWLLLGRQLIKDMLLWNWSMQLTLIQCIANSVVDSMARHASTSQHEYVVWSTPSDDLCILIQQDLHP